MDDPDYWVARSGIANRRAATCRVPTEDLVCEAHAAECFVANLNFDVADGHLEDVGATRAVEDLGPFEKARERLAILAIADQPETSSGPDVLGETVDMPTPAAKGNIKAVARHKSSFIVVLRRNEFIRTVLQDLDRINIM